jgi:anti-anti-sigma factor
MFNAQVVEAGGVTLIRCEGRLVRTVAAYALKNLVAAQCAARTVVLDLGEVEAVEGCGLGMLVFLHHWALDHGQQIKLLNLRPALRRRLEEEMQPIPNFDALPVPSTSVVLKASA